MRHDSRVSGTLRHLDGLQCLGQSTDLVDLDQDGVAEATCDAIGQALGVRDEQVITDELNLAAECIREHLPALEVILSHAIFDGDDRIVRGEVCPESDHFITCLHDVGLPKVVATLCALMLCFFVELSRRRVHCNLDLVTSGVASLCNRFHDDIQGFLVALEVWCVATFISNGCAVALALEDGLQCVEDFGSPAKAFRECLSTHRHHHEFLEVDRVVSVLATVDDVHHRDWELTCAYATNVAVEGEAELFSGCLCNCEGNAKDRICAEVCLVMGAIQLEEEVVDGGLLKGIHVDQLRSDVLIYMVDSLLDTLAQVARLIAITELDRFVCTRGCATWNGCTADDAALEVDIHLNGRIATGIKDLPGLD